MSRYPIPDAALDDRLGFLGMTGSGKTFGAGTCVERILQKGGRVIIPDPLGVWWGLRLASDGKVSSGHDVVIFGGAHGDLPLTPLAGALIGETVGKMRESAIIDLSKFETAASERSFMLAFLEALYRKTTGSPVHLIFDEADLWAPERIMDREGNAQKLHGMMQTVVRRGRVKGLTSWLISQRPASLSKQVLSQVDGLAAFKLTAATDRKALGTWIEGQAASKEEGKAILDRLPTKQLGEAVVWLPGRGILDDVMFPPKQTYDSSRAPKRGEKRQAVELAPLDVGKLQERLATVEQEVKANDPKALRAEVAQLRRELAGKALNVAYADPAAIDAAEKRGRHDGYREGQRHGFVRGYEKARHAMAELVNKIGPPRETEIGDFDPGEVPPAPARRAPVVAARAVLQTPKPAARSQQPAPGDEDHPLRAERKPLAALAAVHPSGMTEAQWAVAAGLKRSGGTWSTYVSRLKVAGRIMRQGDLYYATDVGLADIGSNYEAMPEPGPALVDFWVSRISGIGPMLQRLADVYPHWISRERLAADINIVASGGTFGTYLSRLRSTGLIEENGKDVRAAEALMGRKAA
jgi:hypothetical protein